MPPARTRRWRRRATCPTRPRRKSFCGSWWFPSCRNARRARGPSQRGISRLAGADAHGGREVENEDLAVADCLGAGRLLNRLDDLICYAVWRGHLDLHLREHVGRIFGPPIDFGLPLLPP